MDAQEKKPTVIQIISSRYALNSESRKIERHYKPGVYVSEDMLRISAPICLCSFVPAAPNKADNSLHTAHTKGLYFHHKYICTF